MYQRYEYTRTSGTEKKKKDSESIVLCNKTVGHTCVRTFLSAKQNIIMLGKEKVNASTYDIYVIGEQTRFVFIFFFLVSLFLPTIQ